MKTADKKLKVAGAVLRVVRGNLAVILPATIAIAAAVGLCWAFWGWLQTAEESNSATLRNVALIATAVIGLPLALWRSLVAQRQANAAQRQADTAQRQADTAQRGLLNERYQRGAEMLGSIVLSARLGGIYALENLAREHPQQYARQILGLFCAFARHPTEDADRSPDSEAKRPPRSDVQAVMEMIGCYDQLISPIDTGILNLREADLRKIDLRGANLSGVNLSGANLSSADLFDANLSRAVLLEANLSDAILTRANLSGAQLFWVNLTGADLKHVKELTQRQLNLTRADLSRPPDLSHDALDAESGQRLIWQGRPLKGDA